MRRRVGLRPPPASGCAIESRRVDRLLHFRSRIRPRVTRRRDHQSPSARAALRSSSARPSARIFSRARSPCPTRFAPGICDTGIVQTSSITHDDDATVVAAAAFYQDFAGARGSRSRVRSPSDDVTIVVRRHSAARVRSRRASRRAVASRSATSPGTGSTTRIRDFRPAPDGRSTSCATAYRRADAGARVAVRDRIRGLSARDEDSARRPPPGERPRPRRACTSACPPDGRVALLSFGGYGLPSLDLASVDCRHDWTIVTTDRVTAHGGAVPAHVRAVVEQRVPDERIPLRRSRRGGRCRHDQARIRDSRRVRRRRARRSCTRRAARFANMTCSSARCRASCDPCSSVRRICSPAAGAPRSNVC